MLLNVSSGDKLTVILGSSFATGSIDGDHRISGNVEHIRVEAGGRLC